MKYQVRETIKVKNERGEFITLLPGEDLFIDHVEDGSYLLKGENILAKTSPTVYIKNSGDAVLPVSMELFDKFFYENPN